MKEAFQEKDQMSVYFALLFLFWKNMQVKMRKAV